MFLRVRRAVRLGPPYCAHEQLQLVLPVLGKRLAELRGTAHEQHLALLE